MAEMTKYGFRIETRGGMTVDNLVAQSRTREEAENRIRQIYQHREILECNEITAGNRGDGVDLESMISLISKQDDSG
ncbi:MAG: hypothetical protein ACO22Q_10075 [Burkholderiales bacterium]